MTNARGPRPIRVKKSETLEVRIPYETKQAFLSACRDDGTTASEVVRDKVQDYLDARERPSLNEEKRTLVMKLPQPVRRYGLRVAAGGVAAIGLTSLVVLPSAAAPDFQAQFSRLDVNGDGVLSVEEFLGPQKKDGEVNEEREIVIKSHVTTSSDSADAKPQISLTPEMKRESFTFVLPEELSGGDGDAGPRHEAHEFKFIGTREVTDDAAGATTTRTMSFSLDDIRKEEFAEIDTDKDGRVSLQEYRGYQTAKLTRGFEILDANGDKSLSEVEYARIVAPPMVKMIWSGPDGVEMPDPPKIDIPGMKEVSPEAIKAAFTRLDGNKDGKLSLQEYLPAS